MQETPEDELLLGKLARMLHSLKGYSFPSALNENKQRFYKWFSEKPFKASFDMLLDNLPDFEKYDRYLIHTEDIQLSYRFDLALAFLKGYFGAVQIPEQEYDLLWQGAVYMHISYMQSYGPDAVDSLWKILQFGLEQKSVLWKMIKNA